VRCVPDDDHYHGDRHYPGSPAARIAAVTTAC